MIGGGNECISMLISGLFDCFVAGYRFVWLKSILYPKCEFPTPFLFMFLHRERSFLSPCLGLFHLAKAPSHSYRVARNSNKKKVYSTVMKRHA